MTHTVVTPSGHSSDRSRHGAWTVAIDGRPAQAFFPDGQGIRLLFVDDRDAPTKMVKLDTDDLPQSMPEFELYSVLDEDDRQFFTPISEGGWVDGDSWALVDFVPDWTTLQWNDYTIDHLLPFPSLDRYMFKTDEHAEAWETVKWLARKYELNDMAPRQFKMLPDGQPIIHDFGLNPFSTGWSRTQIG